MKAFFDSTAKKQSPRNELTEGSKLSKSSSPRVELKRSAEAVLEPKAASPVISSRRKSSHELKNSGNELKRSAEQVQEPRSASPVNSSRRKSSHELKNSCGNEINKKSSPRIELKRSDEPVLEQPINSKRKHSHNEIEQPDKRNEGEQLKNNKDEQHADSSETAGLSMKPSYSIENISSGEYDDEPKKSFNLDMASIIKEREDTGFHGRVGAYFDTNLQRQLKPKLSFLTRITFVEYFKYVTEELNAWQRQKYETIQSMVAFLSPIYAKENRSEKNHNRFCWDLMKLIDFCMNTSEESCSLSGFMVESRKTPKEKITLFWDSVEYGLRFSNEEKNNYDLLLNGVVSDVYRGFAMKVKSNQICKQMQERSDKELLGCVAWDFLHVICNLHQITGHDLEQFKLLYKESCFGLAEEFIYVPDMWDFIRNLLDTESKHEVNHHETLQKLDKMLHKIPEFEEFNPERKNSSFIRGMFK